MTTKSKFARPLAAATLLAVLGSAPAFAADAIFEQPPEPAPLEVVPSASTGWAGPYVGVHGGYGWGETESNIAGSRDQDGFNAGVFAGVQGQNGSIVYGVEGDIGYNWADGAAGGVVTESGIEGSLRARLGYAVNDRLLVYATGGGAAERLEANDGFGGDTKTMLGYTVGAGVDAKVTERVFVRGEYRYTDYGSETFALGAGAQEIDSKSNKVQLGLGIKF